MSCIVFIDFGLYQTELVAVQKTEEFEVERRGHEQPERIGPTLAKAGFHPPPEH